MRPALNTPAATAFHQQVQAATPAGCTTTTGGDSSTGRVSALLLGPTGKDARFSGAPADVLAELLAFPATDAFRALNR